MAGTWVVRDGYARRLGRTPIPLGVAAPDPVDPPPPFVLGTTMPTRSINGPRTALTPYSGVNAGGVFKVPSSNMTFQSIDFGNTRIEFAAGVTNVKFIDCRWMLTLNLFNRNLAMIDMRVGNPTNVLIEHCDIDTTAQGNGGMTGIYARNATIRRTNIRNFTDLIGCYMPSSTGGDLNLRVEGNHLSALSFYWAPEGTPAPTVHSNDDKTHNDLIQNQGGTGLEVVGNYMDAHYSTTVGTGTPGSGNEGAPGVGYTYAQGVAKRYEIVEGSGLYSSGKAGEFLGGSIAGLMYSNGTRGNIFDNLVTDNWGGGGAYFLNAGAINNVAPWGIVHRNRFFRNQRHAGYAVAIRGTIAADTGEGTSNRNIWLDNNSEVVRKSA